MTLAIGDGANDVSMINTAHIGVGISGLEGQQASRASDYSIGEFQILSQLCLVHGRECYRRNSELVLYNFYKNLIMVTPSFFYGCWNGFSAVILYDNYLYQLYNIIFTSMPVLVYAVLDREYEDQELLTNGDYYRQGQEFSLFNVKVFVLKLVKSLCIGAFLGVVVGKVDQDMVFVGGLNNCLSATGILIYGVAVFISNYEILIVSYSYNIGLGVIVVAD